jgi:hypothetical protein
MPLTPSDIAQKAGEEAKNILGALPGIAADGAAQYVKIGTPPSLIPNVGLGIARQACRRYADNPDGVPGPVAAGLERVCRPYLDDIGYGTGPTLDKPFDGGQCPLDYFVTFSQIDYNTDGTVASSSSPQLGLRGPLGPVEHTRSGCGPVLGPLAPEAKGFCAFMNTGSGRVLVAGNGNGGVSMSVTSVALQSGAADTCGNPPPVVTPPVPPPTPGPVREPFSPTPGTNIDIDVTIGPTGPITFNIGTGPVTIDPFGGGGGGGGDDGNPGIDQPGTAPSSGLPPGDIGSPGAAEDTATTGKANGCAPPNSVLVGVKVNIIASPAYGSEYDPSVRRGACYVYMGTVGNLALEPAGVALRSGQMFFAPLDNLTCWEVDANTGYVLQVIPYYRALEPQEV